MATPLNLSIITIAKDNESDLLDTLNSVYEGQYFNSIEIDHWVIYKNIDLDNIRMKYPNINFLQQKNVGISNAFNLGLDNVNGNWVIFLNSGDTFLNNSLFKIEYYLLNFGKTHRGIMTGFSFLTRQFRCLPTKGLSSNSLYFGSMISHQATLYNSSLFDSFRFNTEYKIRMDLDLNLTLLKNKVPIVRISEILILYNEDGISGSFSNRFWKEELLILFRNDLYMDILSKSLPRYIYSIINYIKK